MATRRPPSGKRCHGTTKSGERCQRRWKTADPGLSRKAYYCAQHVDQRPADAR